MVSINLAIGPSCFVRCKGCYNYFGNTHRQGGLVTGQEVLDFVTEAGTVGIDQATISGGDPLTHPEIISIIQNISGLGMTVKLDTVGTALLGDAPVIFFGKGTARQVPIEELAPYVHTLGLPLDGATEVKRNGFRIGRTSLVKEVLDTIALAKAAGMRVGVNTVAHQGNIDELTHIMELVIASKADEWQVFEFQPTGPFGSRNADRLLLAAGEFDRATQNFRSNNLKIICKGRAIREGAYFMVDDAGMAWIPGSAGDVRTVIGHITRDRVRVIEHLEMHVRSRLTAGPR